MKFCQQCGSKMEDADIFCPSCGTKSSFITEGANTPVQSYPYMQYPLKKKVNPLAIILPVIGVLIAAAVLLIVFLVPGNSPSSVVKKFLEAAKSTDYRTMVECMMPDAGKGANPWAEIISSMTNEDILSGLQAFGITVSEEDLAQAADFQYKIVKETVDGNEASVLVEFGRFKDKTEQEIHCIKQNGKWYISFF